jgi:hypothetical protein
LLLHNDQATVEDLRIGGPGPVDVPAAGLAEYLDPLPDAETIASALSASFATELACEVTREGLTRIEVQAAEERLVRYEDDVWTWRR